MTIARTLSLSVLCLAAISASHADTITSTAAGGAWYDPLTWEGGDIPDSADDVVVVGPVEIAGAASCRSLHVETAGTVMAAAVAGVRELAVLGPIRNDGTVADTGNYWLDLELHGDVHQAGTWVTHLVTLAGPGDRELSDTSAGGIDSDIVAAADAAGDITATTPVSLTGFVDFGGLRVILEPGSHLSLPATRLSGEVLAQGNELRFETWSYLENCRIDDAVIVGLAEATHDVVFTTRLTVKGQLQNGTGGGGAAVEGDLVNHGTIRNDQYSFFFRVHGDVENHGTIATPQLMLEGVGVTHHLAMGPDAHLDASVFLPEFQAATLVVTTPATFAGGLGIGVGSLILEAGASLHFPNHSGVSGIDGTVAANGNSLTTEGVNSAISGVVVDRAVLGDATLLGDLTFTGGLTVTGAVVGFAWNDADVTVEGRLRVEGSTADNGDPLRITALNDLENLGSMTNSRVTLAGGVDQFVGAGPGIAVPEFVLESGLQAAGYQWFRDGEPMPGETGAALTFNTVGAADYGVYHCEGDGQFSRSIVIAEQIDTTDVPGPAAAAILEQNQPNPFNPATNIAFRLDRAGPVSLVVYDLAGREVDRLVQGDLSAGRHAVAWQPRGLASGVYVYRLRAEGVDLARKCSLLK